ncbi:MAG: isopentenyl-diphosphate Delta-isomerase [Chitinophagales bacterium]
MKKEFVILVNKSGRRIGVAEKIQAHEQGLLHRAFSIFLFNDKGEMLLQRRAKHKYHFAGLWSNACCSHPRSGENVLSAAKRRLREELNLETALISKGATTYKFFDSKSGLTEHEYDHIFFGRFNEMIRFNRREVETVRWVSLSKLKKEMKAHPEKFTPWFLEIVRVLGGGDQKAH